jgi:transcription elongation GreA/GreB family factor
LIFRRVNKSTLLAAIIAKLSAELDTLTAAALASHAEATDAENKAENKYDTRGLEASYLAQGQSNAAEEAALALAQFQALSVRDFAPDEPATLGALVALSDSAAKLSHYFIGPRAGGTEIGHAGGTVLVITPSSPLGRQVVGRRVGDTLELAQRGRSHRFRIVSVS